MAKVRFSNFASARLAARVGPTTTSFEVAAGEGAEFPVLADGEVFYAVVVEPGVTTVEIVKAISRSGDRITVQRGIGGTPPSAWSESAMLELRPLAQAFEEAESYIGAGELATVLEGEGGVEVTRLGDTVQIYSPALKSGRSRGALIATSATLPTAATESELSAHWVLEPDAPTGTEVQENEVLLPRLRPEDNIDGIWVVALVDGDEVSEVKFPWGASSLSESVFGGTSEFQTGVLRFRGSLPAGAQDAIFVKAILEVRAADPLLLSLVGDNQVLPANSTAKVYWSVTTGVTGGGTGNENTRGRLLATTTDLPTAETKSGDPVATTWVVESDAPAGITSGSDAKLYIPDLRPENDVDGFWAVSEVRGREIEEVKFTWGVAGAERERLTGERKIAPLKLVRPVVGGTTGVFVDVKMVALEDQPTYLQLTGNDQTLPGEAKVRIYFSVVATAGGGPGSGRTRGTDLGVRTDPDQLTVTSSTGGNVILPAATETQAGVMTATDKGKGNRSLEAAETIDESDVVVGATDGTREVRGATGTDLTRVAAQLSSGERGAQELALKSELGFVVNRRGGGGNARGRLIASSGTLPEASMGQGVVAAAWTVSPDAPAGVSVSSNGDRVFFPALRPENNVDGVWIVALVDGVEVSETKATWGGLGTLEDQAGFEKKVGPLKFVEATPGVANSAAFLDVVSGSPDNDLSFIRLDGSRYTLPANATARMYLSVVTGAGAQTPTSLANGGITRGALFASSGPLPVSAADQLPLFPVDWTLEPDAPFGVRIGGGLQGSTSNADWVELPALRPADDVTGVWAVALVDDVEISEVLLTWGVSGETDRPADPVLSESGAQKAFATLKFREAVDDPNAVAPLVSALYIDVVKVTRQDYPTYIRLGSDGLDLPPNSTVKLYWAVTSGGGVATGAATGGGGQTGGTGSTNLGVEFEGGDQVKITSDTGTDAVIPTATSTEAGVMTTVDRYRVDNAIWSLDRIEAGKLLTGVGSAQGGSLRVQEATDVALDALAGDLASGARGGNELALKSELSGDGRGRLLATSSTLPTAATASGTVVANTWTLESGIPTGVTTGAAGLVLPETRPSEDVDGIWLVAEVDGTEFAEVKIPWGYSGETTDHANNKYKYTALKFRNAVLGGASASFLDAVLLVNTLTLIGVNTALPANSVVKVYLSVVSGGPGSAAIAGPGTDLSVDQTAINVKIVSSTGSDATIVGATQDTPHLDGSVTRGKAGLLLPWGVERLRGAVTANGLIEDGKFITGSGSSVGDPALRVQEASEDDLTALAGDLASGDRGANELALKSEIGPVGSDALIAAATVDEGDIVVGASDATRDVRAATSADLTDLAAALADGARGASELALKSELGSGGGGGGGSGSGNSRGALIATGTGFRAIVSVLTTVPANWTLDANAPTGTSVSTDRNSLLLPLLRPADNVDGIWVVAHVGNTDVAEVKLPWGVSGIEADTFNSATSSYAKLIIRSGSDSGGLLLRTNVGLFGISLSVEGASSLNPPTGTSLRVYLSVAAGGGGTSTGTGEDTDLSVTRTATEVVVASSTGTDATLPAATETHAGVQSAADKVKSDRSLQAALTVDADKFVVGATDGTRNVQEATDAALDALAGDLASGDRGGNELALKSELGSGGGGGGATDLSVTRDANNVVVVSSSGADATLPAASVTQAGVMTASDKNQTSRALTAAAEVGAGRFIAGAGGRNTREAMSTDLTALATSLASGDRGAAELALKSELPGGGSGGSLVHLVDDMAYQAADPADGVLIDLDADLQAGNLLVCHWDEAAQATRGIISVTVVSDEIIGLENSVTDPTTADWSDAFKVMLPRPESDTFHQEAAYFWRHADADKFYVALSRDGDHALTFNLYSIAFGGGGAAGGATDLSVTRTANNLVVASSTGANATLPGASTTEAGVMSAADKTKTDRAVEAAAVVPAGSVVVGSDGTRNVHAATAANLTALAAELADGARGGSELALKSELSSGGGGGGEGGGGNARGALVATSNTFSRSISSSLRTLGIEWTVEADAPTGVEAVRINGSITNPPEDAKRVLLVPHLRPEGFENVDGLWFVALVNGVEVNEVKLPWGVSGLTDNEGPEGEITAPLEYGRGSQNPPFLGVYVFRNNDGDYAAGKIKYSIESRSGMVPPAGSTIKVYLSVVGGGGGGGGVTVDGVDARIASWAQAANTDDIPGAKLANAGVAVVANAQASLTGFNVGSLVFNLEDQHFYRVLEDQTHANYALRITFAPDEISTDAIDFWSQGYAREAVAPYAEAAHGTLGNIPNVLATVPATLDALIAVTEDDRSAGSVLIGIDSTSTFVPARMRWRVNGMRFDKRVGFDGGVVSGVHRYFLSSSFDRSIGNPFRIAEGQTEDQTVDFDITDASGVSIAPATTARRYLERIDLPGTVTAFAGNVSVPYGRHEAPKAQSGILIDDLTGDEYYARRSTDPDLVIVEPVDAGAGTYGLAPGNGASFNAPSGLSRLAWDPVTGLVDVEGAAASLNGWKKVSHVSDPAEGGGNTREARLVEVPSSTTPLGARRKRALLCDWHPNLVRLTAAANSDGDPQLSVTGGNVWYDVSARRLRMQLRYPQANVDDGQLIGLQRVTPEVSSNIHWRCGIQESASDDGTVPATGLWGDLGGGLHPVWFEWSLRVVGTPAEQRAGSYIEAGHRVLADETMWMVLYYHSEETEDFISVAPTLGNAIKLSHDPTDVTTGSVQRHRYVIADDATIFPGSIYSIPTGTQPWYVGLVITPNNATNVEGFVRSLEPINFNQVEIEGVPIPMAMSERRMVLQSGTQTSALVSSILQTDWQSAAFSSDQEAPLVAAGVYAVDYTNRRGVRGRTYRSHTQPASKHAASAFQLLDSADNAETTSEGARAWWEVRSRGLPRTVAPPRDQGAPWRLRRWGGEEHRAVPDRTEHDVQGYVVRDEAVSGQFQIVNWSRTALQQLTDGAGSVVIEEVTVSRVTSGNRDLTIRAATGGPLTAVEIRVVNRSQGWTATFASTTPLNQSAWRVQLATAQYPFEEGDEVRLRLNATGHSPIGWNHAVTSWQDV